MTTADKAEHRPPGWEVRQQGRHLCVRILQSRTLVQIARVVGLRGHGTGEIVFANRIEDSRIAINPDGVVEPFDRVQVCRGRPPTVDRLQIIEDIAQSENATAAASVMQVVQRWPKLLGDA